MTTSPKGLRLLSAQDKEQIAAEVVAGIANRQTTYTAIGRRYGISVQRVQSIAKSRGVYVPSPCFQAPPKVTAAVLKTLLHYDPFTGIFTWKMDRRSARAGDRAGSLGQDGYVKISVYNRSYRAARLAWLYMTGAWPIQQIDHRNVCPTDDRWENLREATPSQNRGNTNKTKRNTSGFKGVSFHKGEQRWQAAICRQGKSRHLGWFDTPEAAHAAYEVAAKALFGRFARIA